MLAVRNLEVYFKKSQSWRKTSVKRDICDLGLIAGIGLHEFPKCLLGPCSLLRFLPRAKGPAPMNGCTRRVCGTRLVMHFSFVLAITISYFLK